MNEKDAWGNLNNRTINALKRLGFEKIEDLLEMTDTGLKKLYWIGKDGLKSIRLEQIKRGYGEKILPYIYK